MCILRVQKEMEHFPLFCIALSEVTTRVAGIREQLHGGY